MDRSKIPEIRIRKGSDAPSLGEQDKSGAPLASFEALSDLESESDCGELDSAFTTPTPASTSTQVRGLHNESIDSGVGGGDTSGGATSSMEMEVTEAEEVYSPPTPTGDNATGDNGDVGEQEYSSSDNEPAQEETEDDDDDDDGEDVDGNATPTGGAARTDDFGYAQFDATEEPESEDETGEDEGEGTVEISSTNPFATLDPGMNKAIATGMLSGSAYDFSDFESPLPEKPKEPEEPAKDGPARPPPPRRPPPPSGSGGKAAPPRPKPPRPVSPANAGPARETTAATDATEAPAKIKITLPKHEMKKKPKKPPGPRPPPPKVQQQQAGEGKAASGFALQDQTTAGDAGGQQAAATSWETFDDGSAANKEDLELMKTAETASANLRQGGMGSAEDQSALCESNSYNEKKHKGKVFSGKKIKGLVDSTSKKIADTTSKTLVESKKILKAQKKEKREKHHHHHKGGNDDLSKYLSERPDPDKIDKNSENWKAFEQMNARIQETMAKTHEKMEKLGPEIEQTVSSVQQEDSMSPWGVPSASSSNVTAGQDATSNVKSGWEGFEDTFEVTPNMELNKRLPHLNVSPIQSPQHNPLPPYNSRRTSLEGSENEADLLSGFVNNESSETKVDLLGIDGTSSSTDQTETVASITADIVALSRNPQQADRSSTNPSPVPDSTNLFSGADDFLGLSGDAGVPAADSDDPFGLGTSGASGGQASEGGEGDLYLGEVDDDAELFRVPDVDELIAKAAEAQELGEDLEVLEKKEKEAAKRAGPSAIARPRARAKPKPDANGCLLTMKPPTKREILASQPKVGEFDPRSDPDVIAKPVNDDSIDLWGSDLVTAAVKSDNPFEVDLFATEQAAHAYVEKNPGKNPFTTDEISSSNPFASELEAAEGADIPYADDGEGSFNPFATITHDDALPTSSGDGFDPFATIHDDEALVADDNIRASFDGGDGDGAGSRVNPFNKEPPLDEKYASFEPTGARRTSEASATPNVLSSESSMEEELEPLPLFHQPFQGQGWQLLLRQPTKKKLTGNRFWKPVYVRMGFTRNTPSIRVFHKESDSEHFHELLLQPCYNLCNMGLQQYDQYGKCHTLKIQYVFYRERVGVKAERLAPTLGDLVRVRDLKGFKDLVHKPKTTMILDHAPQASELLKFGSLNYNDFLTFLHTMEDTLFHLKASRDTKSQEYTKDEITMDILDEYVLEIDSEGHIVYHKARVRVFCIAFLSGNSYIEVGLNEKSRRGKEIVGRHDIIPIKTEEWIKIEDQEFHSSVNIEEYEKNKILKLHPLDACTFEVMRFRVRPRLNKELPLQIRVQQIVQNRHIEIRADILIPGYYTNSRRCAQTPCEDIQIRFPIPEEWIYLFRVEKRFRYGSVHSAKRKPGKIKGLERLTQIAQGMMPPSLIEVSNGLAKYENVFGAVVWRINRLPERNEGAYKQHLFVLRLDLGPHDHLPQEFNKRVHVEYTMPNSTVSRAQIRSISIGNNPCDDPPDRWVHHTAKYNYTVEIEFVDPDKPAFVQAAQLDETATAGDGGGDSDSTIEGAKNGEQESSSSSSSSDDEE